VRCVISFSCVSFPPREASIFFTKQIPERSSLTGGGPGVGDARVVGGIAHHAAVLRVARVRLRRAVEHNPQCDICRVRKKRIRGKCDLCRISNCALCRI
jgi:hypothetical protein